MALRSKRRKQRVCFSVGVRCTNVVLYILESSAKRRIRMTEHDFMELKNIVWRQRNIFKALMNNIQRVTIAGDFAFIPVSRRGLLAHQLTKTRFRCANALYFVGRFGALNFCNFDEPVKLPRLLPEILCPHRRRSLLPLRRPRGQVYRAGCHRAPARPARFLPRRRRGGLSL